MLEDLRYATRMLRKKPGFTAMATATLAVGIGLNVAVFSSADALLWKPLEIPNIERVLALLDARVERKANWIPTSPATFLEWKSRTRAFEHLAAYRFWNANLNSAAGETSRPERVYTYAVTAEFFALTRVQAAVGRTLNERDADQRVAVISHEVWQRRFNSDPNVAGKVVRLDDRAHAIVGVMPETFKYPVKAELWVPLTPNPRWQQIQSSHDLFVIGRLKDGISHDQAAAELQGIAADLARRNPEAYEGWVAYIKPLRDFVTGDLTASFSLFLLGAVGCVLLIACANVANLQFARATSRAREIAIRLAVGASRGRIIRQLLTETIVLAVLGAAGGLLLADWSIDLIRTSMPRDIVPLVPGFDSMAVDWRAFAFAAVIALTAGIVSGLAPAFHTSKAGVNSAPKEGSRHSAGASRQRMRSVLACSQIVLAVVLLSGAALMVKGFSGLFARDAHLRAETLLTFRISLPQEKYRTPDQIRTFYDGALASVQSVPGVESASLATALPHSGHSSRLPIVAEGRTAPRGEQNIANIQSTSPEHFATVNTPVKIGRGISRADGPDAPRVAVVSESVVRRFWPNADAVGRRLRIAASEDWITVVGVAGDVPHNFFEREARLSVYIPFAQHPDRVMDVAVRAALPPTSLMQSMQAAIGRVDPDQPIYELKTMSRLIDDELIGLRNVVVMMSVMGIIALVLSSIGVYGVMSTSVLERTQEIGIRVALGANRTDVLTMVFNRGLKLTITGVVLGVAIAWFAAQAVASLVFGVSSRDLFVFTAVPAALAAVALLAVYIPARRALKVDPIVALRYE
jgi:putative ABC transport system permease protein